MILALSLLLMWQGSFAQPQLAPNSPPNSVTNNGTNSQHVADSPTVNLDKNSAKLDGRYGVDRSAMEKQAKEAAKPQYISGAPGAVRVQEPVSIKADSKSSLVWDDATGSVPLTCKVDGTGTGWICKVVKPSPQITAVRAVAHEQPIETTCKYQQEHPDPNGSMRFCTTQPTWYECTDDSALGPFPNRKGEHWCLKIEEK